MIDAITNSIELNPEATSTLLVVTIAYAFFEILMYFLDRFAKKREFKMRRVFYIHKLVGSAVFIVVAFLLCFIWGIDMHSLSLIATSFFAVTGIALFAQWSILSNITSSVVIFFFFPARIGDTIKIVDGDNSAEGIIAEISMFQIQLIDVDGNSLFYPNNLILQKPVIKMNVPNKDM